MVKALSKDIILRIHSLRKHGYSLPEIQKDVNVGYGTVFRYIQGIKILPHHRELWLGKRGGSTKRKKIAEMAAKSQAEKTIRTLTYEEKLIFLSAIYWSEGSKSDFNVINSDPILIAIVVQILLKTLKIERERIRLSIRIYEDIDESDAKSYWSTLTGIPAENFSSSEIIKGEKQGKLVHGMCRVRVRKGSDLLKYMKAVYSHIAEIILSP